MKKELYLCILIFLVVVGGVSVTENYRNGEVMRRKEIESKKLQDQKTLLILDLKTKGIKNAAVLEAIKKVPREEFIPRNLRSRAYENVPLPIGYDQTISSPYMVAYMVQAANLKKDSQVLEIGTGSGYQTAILSLLCERVFSVEIISDLAEAAKKLLRKLALYPKEIQIGSGHNTSYDNNSFDAIIVTAAPTSVPKHLKNLLKINGRLIIPVGNELHQQKLLRITKKSDDQFIEEKLLDVRFVPMVK